LGPGFHLSSGSGLHGLHARSTVALYIHRPYEDAL